MKLEIWQEEDMVDEIVSFRLIKEGADIVLVAEDSDNREWHVALLFAPDKKRVAMDLYAGVDSADFITDKDGRIRVSKTV